MTSFTPAVQIVNGQPRVSSLDIADHFQKRHTEVLRSVRVITQECPPEFNERNFALVEYADIKGEMRPMYSLSRDGFTLLAMGFAGKKALAWKLRYIEAFNAMEKALLEQARTQAKAQPSPDRPDANAGYRIMREDMAMLDKLLGRLVCHMQVYGLMSGAYSKIDIIREVRSHVGLSMDALDAAREHLRDANRYALLLR